MNDELKNSDIIEYIISEESKGLRVDQGIAKENKQFSRSLIQKWIKNGNIKINDNNIKSKDIIFASGFKENLIKKKVGNKFNFIKNKDYENTNMVYTFFNAIKNSSCRMSYRVT